MSFVAFDIRRLDVVEGEVAAFLVTEFGHPPEKVGVDRRVPGLNADKAEPQHLRLLRACRERPRSGRATDQRDEIATFHFEHRGLPPLCVIGAADWPVLSLPQPQPAAGRPANPWGKPEMF